MITTLITAIPALVGWLINLFNGDSWVGYWRASAISWLLSNRVAYKLSPAAVSELPISAPAQGITLMVTPLVMTLIIIWFGYQNGRRQAGHGLAWPAILFGAGVYTAFAIVLASSATWKGSHAGTVSLFVGPALCYGLPALVGALLPAPETGQLSSESRRLRARLLPWRMSNPVSWRQLSAGFSLARRLLFGLLAVSAGCFAVAVVINWFRVVEVMQQLGTNLPGVLALTLGQVAALPNFIISTFSWMLGAPLSVGSATASVWAVAPGAIPAVPTFVLLPVQHQWFHYSALAIPFVAVLLTLKGWQRQHGLSSAAIATAAIASAVAALVASALAGGVVGHDFGPNPWFVALAMALHIGVAGGILMLAEPKRNAEASDISDAPVPTSADNSDSETADGVLPTEDIAGLHMFSGDGPEAGTGVTDGASDDDASADKTVADGAVADSYTAERKAAQLGDDQDDNTDRI